MWPFTKRKKSPLELYKEKEDEAFFEAIRCAAIRTFPGGGWERLGMSEYGAEKQYQSGKDPEWPVERVLTEEGDLIPYAEWKEKRQCRGSSK